MAGCWWRNGGDVDDVAQRVCRAFPEGVTWVHRYYSVGSAPLEYEHPAGLGLSTAGGDTDPHGASWTWNFPFHYAPLMQDLARNCGRMRVRTKGVLAGSLSLSRSLPDTYDQQPPQPHPPPLVLVLVLVLAVVAALVLVLVVKAAAATC
ncbi:hypothetical protein FOA52_007285 [Chlamydomonas sp. UWO 241]|nr:hypothetical protein FOA52_007285 [Chlamydomonas sp. UWO 241]